MAMQSSVNERVVIKLFEEYSNIGLRKKAIEQFSRKIMQYNEDMVLAEKALKEADIESEEFYINQLNKKKVK